MTAETKKTAAAKKLPAKKPARPKKKAEPKATVSVEGSATEPATLVVKGSSFIPAIGRRKTSVARVALVKNGKGLLTVNGKPLPAYFGSDLLQGIVKSPLQMVGQETALDVSAKVQGGGLHSQAEAVRLGVSRALTVLNPTFRKTLKKLGYLTRDPRAKERKKPGLKRARRAPQWSKR